MTTRLGLALVMCALSTTRAVAGDAFEIQVYDTETAPAGEPGLEVHVNHHVIDGAPDALHTTLEPHYGLADWAELGGYLQFAGDSTGDLAYAGVKLRLKLRAPRRVWDERVGLALNGELSAIPSRFEANTYGSEIRPVVDLRVGRLYAAFNPILTTDLRGELAGHPQLEPSAKAGWHLTADLMLGVEGYASFGPIDHLGAESQAAYVALDVRGARWDLNAGLGWAWGDADHAVAKVILGLHPREP